MINLKESGIQWLGSIPCDWEATKLLNVLRKPISDGPHETPDFCEGGIPFISVDSLNDTKGVDLKCCKKYISQDLYDEYNKKTKLEKGDVLFSKAATIGKTAIVGDEKFMVWSPLAVIRVNFKKYHNEYLYYLLNCDELIKHISGMGTYNTQINVGMRSLERAPIPVPPVQEQRIISDFLDQKVSKIDTLIANQQQQIEKLKQYKQSLITEVVTKGLDRNVAMKDSGIKWINKMPIHWDCMKIKHSSWLKGRIGWDGLKSSEFIDDGPYLITGTDFVNGSINWDTCVHISESRFNEDELLHIHESDLLITKDGTVGKLAIVKNCPEKVSLNSGVMIIRNTKEYKYYDKYLYYILQSQQFKEWYERSQNGNSTIKHLYQEQFYNFQFTFPPMEEQIEISSYLDGKIDKTDKLINLHTSKVDKLNQYKKSLIYEYVTGKKRVSVS